MNLHLYKVWRIDDSNPNDPCESVIVMTEKDIREEFLTAYNEGGIPEELIEDFEQDSDYKKEKWNDVEKLRVGTMIDMLNEICNYIPGVGYYITETDVDVEPNKEMLDKWLDVLNYFDSDVQDAAERENKMSMYKKYEQVQDEIYRLTKGE